MNSNDNIPLVELARPLTLEDIILEEDTKKQIELLLKEPSKLPHLILAGLPGTGKTSLARILANELLGNITDFNYLELNASCDRGINVIRETLKNFISSSSFMKMNAPKTPYKIIFLDEACSLTADAQLALRNLMETYVSTARFIFSANHLQKIHPALLSRSLVIKFPKINTEKMYEKVLDFSRKNNLKFKPEEIKKACLNADGDFRKVYNYLGLSNNSPAIVDHNDAFCRLLITLFKKYSSEDYFKLKETQKHWAFIKDDSDQFIETFLNYLDQTNISDEKLFFIVDRLSKAEFAIKLGANTTNQIYGWIYAVLGLNK